MKESYRENLASSSGLEPYAGGGNFAGVASARGSAGQPLSSEITHSACRSRPGTEKTTSSLPYYGEAMADAAESETLSMCGHSKRENRETLLVSAGCDGDAIARRNGQKTSQAVMLT
jgi:hypothetical protein